MKYNIEKINELGKMLAEVIEAASQAGALIGDVEMTMRESLRETGQSALKCILENAPGEIEAEIECRCGGKLQYQRRRAATIGSVFGKVTYKRA